MEFSIDDGDGLDFKKGAVPPLLNKIITALSGLPDGKLWTLTHLASEVDCHPRTILDYSRYSLLEPYKTRVKHKGARINVYGNQATISKLMEGLDNE
jgi:hypothetical protein